MSLLILNRLVLINHYLCMGRSDFFQEYVVEDVDGEMTGSDWLPPPLPAEHVQQLKSLGLLWNEMGHFSFSLEEYLLKRELNLTIIWLLLLSWQFFTLGKESPIHDTHKYLTGSANVMGRLASFCLFIHVRKWEMGTNFNTQNENWLKPYIYVLTFLRV